MIGQFFAVSCPINSGEYTIHIKIAMLCAGLNSELGSMDKD